MRMLALILVWIGLTGQALADTPTMRVAVLKFGTVNWLMNTITHHKLDTKHGYALEVVPLAGKAATTIALQSGDADAIVTDWVWAMRQREQGVAYRFLPYSRALGALMVRPDAGIESVCDLAGKSIGVAGGAIDKSWLVLQALAKRDCGIDLAAEVTSLFGAPPLMSRQIETGDVQAVSTFWHFAARLEAGGMIRKHGVDQVLALLGIEPAPPLIGFVWNEDELADRAGLADAFAASIRDASDLLANDDSEWERLRPKMNAKTDAEFTLLRDYFRAGVVSDWTEADTEAARALHEALIGIGGQAYRNTSGPFDPALFPGVDG